MITLFMFIVWIYYSNPAIIASGADRFRPNSDALIVNTPEEKHEPHEQGASRFGIRRLCGTLITCSRELHEQKKI
jgi:hypothetical protein